jgi:hypothetical protein
MELSDFLKIGEVNEVQESSSNERDYAPMGNAINRIISISILGGFERDRFIHGLIELPLIGNFVYILEESAVLKITGRRLSCIRARHKFSGTCTDRYVIRTK